jgi:hypothetical protein
MKTTTLFIAALFIFQTGLLFAANEGAPLRSDIETQVLAPVTPAEATFEEMEPTRIMTGTLAPVTPAEADFSDAIESTVVDNSLLAPVTPAEADFE